MRRSGTVSIKDLIKLCIKQNNLEDGIDSVRIRKIWRNITGEYISKATTDMQIYNQSLIVHINSSILRSEIMLIRSELIKRINKEIGRDFISEIILR
jgi:hypothetical protein